MSSKKSMMKKGFGLAVGVVAALAVAVVLSKLVAVVVGGVVIEVFTPRNVGIDNTVVELLLVLLVSVLLLRW